MRAYVEGKGLSFTYSNEIYTKRMIDLMLDTPKRGYKIDIFDLRPESMPEEKRHLRKNVEIFFRKIQGFPLLIHEPGTNGGNREKYSLRPDAEDKLRFNAVASKVRRVRSRRNEAHQAVLGHLPTHPKKRKKGCCTGDPLHFVGGSREHRRPGSQGSPQNTQDANVSQQYSKHPRKASVALPPVTDAFQDSFKEIEQTLQGVPGETALEVRVLIDTVNKTAFSVEEFRKILDSAVVKALGDPEVKRKREWVLKCLRNPTWARKFLQGEPAPVALVEPSTPSLVEAPSTSAGSQASLEAEIDRNLQTKYPEMPQSMRQNAASRMAVMIPKAHGMPWLAHFVAKVEECVLRKRDQGAIRNNKYSLYAYFCAIIADPNPWITQAAFDSLERHPNAYRDFWKPKGTSEKDLNSYPERFRELVRLEPRVLTIYEEWKALKAKAPAPDSPGFLDHFDAERKKFNELVVLAEGQLGDRKKHLQDELRARLVASKLQEESLVWRRAWNHHWNRIICEMWDIE
ncbi:hypothetical protein [Geothrix sp. 21YS21S-2]|uniref:hypothetical protein n=1 Tax=Geothrix sp. 21YS21S-2 TaxID=3068893 RepID=UPI0027BB19F8|nr:hypothetical protein [Geothrix sp. 21YS21S-2]